MKYTINNEMTKGKDLVIIHNRYKDEMIVTYDQHTLKQIAPREWQLEEQNPHNILTITGNALTGMEVKMNGTSHSLISFKKYETIFILPPLALLFYGGLEGVLIAFLSSFAILGIIIQYKRLGPKILFSLLFTFLAYFIHFLIVSGQ